MNLAVIDQAMISAANFFIDVILARHLGPAAFGRYVLLWLCVLFLNSFQLSMIISPLMNIGPKQEPNDLPAYCAAVLAQQVIFSVLSSLLLIVAIMIAGTVSPGWHVGHLALPLGLVVFSCQLQDFLRRLLFATSHPATALFNDAVRYLGQTAAFLILCRSPQFALESVFWLIAASSFTSVVLCSPQIGRMTLTRGAFFSTLSRHWMFSKWLAPSTLMEWTAGHLFVAISGFVLGSAQAGAMKACQNVLGFSHVLIQSLQNIVPLKASHHFHQHGIAGLRKYLQQLVLVAGGAMAMICLLAASLPHFWLNLMYGSNYLAYTFVLRWYALIYMISFLSRVLEFGLRAMENTRPIFLALCGGTLLTFFSGYYLVLFFELNGAMFGMMVSTIINFLVLSYFFSHAAPRAGTPLALS